ncbi:MAG: winged helix-turn-helix transcriptional regulator [Planctomycetes bacterium]|nr:winged helix-turn-helix transcriptional regulator [Planctomycetota bacterium]
MNFAPARTPVDRLFRAFSDRTRIRILHLLRDGELCVGDLVSILGVPQAKTSRHLAYLRRAELVVAREDGLWMFYSLAPARSAFHEKLLECLAACFQEVPDLAADARQARRVRKSGGCCPDDVVRGRARVEVIR